MNDLEKLYLAITKDKGEPLDIWEIAALLEIYGIRDIDAQEEYGYEDVFALAQALLPLKNIKSYPQQRVVTQEKIPPKSVRIKRNFLKGIAFAMPMLVQTLSTLVLGFAIWSDMHASIYQATIIALGTFAALVVTGGPAQIIGRKGLYYLKMKEYNLATKAIKVLYIFGFIQIVVLLALFYLFDSLFYFFSEDLFLIFILTYFLLSLLFLTTAIYYVFEEYGTILYFFLFGLVLVVLIHYIFSVKLPWAQFIALFILDGVMLAFAYKKIEKLKSLLPSEGEILPRPSMMVYTLLPFYLYGFFYFLFLVMDRLVAWSANSHEKGLFIWFDSRYEIGSDLALVIFVVMMGIVEIFVYEFLYRMNEKVFDYDLLDFQKFNNDFSLYHRKVARYFTIFAAVTIMAIYIAILAVKYLFAIEVLPFDGWTQLVFVAGAMAFAFLAHALMNALILFSFSRQQIALKGIVYGVLVNVIVGTVLSRTGNLYLSVFGLLLGSAVFWYITYDYLKKMFAKLDYYYYSAY